MRFTTGSSRNMGDKAVCVMKVCFCLRWHVPNNCSVTEALLPTSVL